MITDQKLSENFIQKDVILAPFTTVKIGGPAKYFAIAKTSDELIRLVKFALVESIPYTILGAGSDTLISDKGFEGLVIINKSTGIQILDDYPFASVKIQIPPPRLEQPHAKDFFSIDGLDYDHEVYPPVAVKFASGELLIKAIYALLTKGITGLEMFAGVPGSFGGALFTNAHGGRRFFGELLLEAEILDEKGKVRVEKHDYFQFDYNYSLLQKSKEIVTSVTLKLRYGDVQQAKNIALEWAKRKSLQPQKSLGSVFHNLTHDQMKALGFPTTSAGYLIDKVLDLRGKLQIGDAKVSEETANIIKNTNNAKAKDFKALIDEVKKRAKNTVGIDLIEEIKYLGEFDK